MFYPFSGCQGGCQTALIDLLINFWLIVFCLAFVIFYVFFAWRAYFVWAPQISNWVAKKLMEFWEKLLRE